MRLINTMLITMLLTAIGAQCLAQERSFDGITCQTNILKALVGRHMPNAKVADIESRYRGIHLKYLGGFGLPEDPYFLGTWLICGTEYLVLEKQSIVRDVLQSRCLPNEPNLCLLTAPRKRDRAGPPPLSSCQNREGSRHGQWRSYGS